MACELDHVLCYFRASDAVEIILLVAQLVGIAQGGAKQAIAERLDRDDMFAVGQDDAGQRHAIAVLHGVADHGKGIDAGLAVRRDVIGMVESEEHTSELQSRQYLVCRLLLEKKKQQKEW